MNSNDLLGRLDFLNHPDRPFISQLAHQLAAGNLVVFAGAGLSRNARYRDGGPSRIPDWPKLAELFKRELGDASERETDALKLADYYEAKFGRNALVDRVIREIADDDHFPGPVHRCLADINLKEVITTNFDTLIERAFRDNCRLTHVIASETDLTHWCRSTRIIKINGCVKAGPGDIAITGNDFLAHVEKRPLLQTFILKNFVDSQVLFIGFSLEDPSFQMINERVVRALGEDCPHAYCLAFDATKEKSIHWYRRKVQIVNLGPLHGCTHTPEERLYRVLNTLIRLTNLSRARLRASSGPRDLNKGIERRFEAFISGKECPLSRRLRISLVQHAWKLISNNTRISSFRTAPGMSSLLAVFRFLHINCLGTRNMADRARFLSLYCLCAPLSALVTLAALWRSGGDARGLVESRGLLPFERTPDELRIPLIRFCAMDVDEDNYKKALGSLWQQLLRADRRRAEIGYRYRYLYRHLEHLKKTELIRWATTHLQEDRLERVLSDLFLGSDDEKHVLAAGEAVDRVLNELRMGWVYSTLEPSGGLRRAWTAAQRDAAEGHSNAVPWEALVILTLAIDGERLEAWFALLQEAWQRQVLDLAFLIEYLALRLGEDGFDTWDIPHYEIHLARFVRWSGRLLAGEHPESPERRCFVDKLAEPLFAWTAARQASTLRRALVGGLSALVALDPEVFGPRLRRWIAVERSQGRTGLNELTALVPVEGKWLADEPQLRQLVAKRVSDSRPLPFGLRNWLLDWACCGVFKQATLKILGRLFARSLREESQGGSLGWLSLAARTRSQPEILQVVEPRLRHRRSEESSTLFDFVKSALRPILDNLRTRLDNLDADNGEPAEDYASKVAGYHPYFIPFAPDLDAEFLDHILGPVRPEQSYTREGTAGFLAALLKNAPEALRAKHGTDWQRNLKRLIKRGATAEGTLGPLVAALPSETVETLEDNLVALAVRRAALDDTRPVEWIADTLIEAPTDALPALEEGLVELVTSPSLAVAEGSLAAILGPVAAAIPDYLERHRRRLRRVAAIVEGRGGYRPTSRFAARLEDLRRAIAPADPAGNPKSS